MEIETLSVINYELRLKNFLDQLYDTFNNRELIKPDPLQFVYRFSNTNDMEIAALLASCLAYGRVQQIENSLDKLFELVENKPFDFILSFDARKRRKIAGFKHRFNTGEDISCLFAALKNILKKYKTLENYFLVNYSGSDPDIIKAATAFVQGIRLVANRYCPGRGFRYLLPCPSSSSPCKRLNLFLRWMVRSDNIDTGLWCNVDPAKLIIPMDVHMIRITRMLGFHDKKNISLKVACRVTDAFSKYAPEDPVKYDFALCRSGMIGEDLDFDFKQETVDMK